MWQPELPAWFLAQGAVAWPLLLCSMLTLAILLERTFILLALPRLGERHCQTAARCCRDCASAGSSCTRLGWQHGVYLLRAHRDLPRPRREEVVGVWLVHVQQALQRRLRLLQLVGVLSPMLGLLGTVLGMLGMFQGMAADGGPVTPAVLADGLFQALYSTAWGLVIALPALGGGQALGLWAASHVERLQELLNRCMLAMDGLEPEVVIGSAPPSRLELSA